MGKNNYFATGTITCEDVDIFSYRDEIRDYFRKLDLEKVDEPLLVLFVKRDSESYGAISAGSLFENTYTIGAFLVAIVTLYDTTSDVLNLITEQIKLLTEQLEVENINQGLGFVVSHPNALKAVRYFCERWGWKINYFEPRGKLSEEIPRNDKEDISSNVKIQKDISQSLQKAPRHLLEQLVRKIKSLKLLRRFSKDSPGDDKENVSPSAKTRREISNNLQSEKIRLTNAMIRGDVEKGEQALDNIIQCEKKGMELSDKSPAYIGT